MAPSIWSTTERGKLAVSTGVDPGDAIGYVSSRDHGWIIADDPEGRSPFGTMYEAANALAGVTGDIEYSDYLLGKGEESRTVYTTSEQVKRIIDEGGWKMISASAPRGNDVN